LTGSRHRLEDQFSESGCQVGGLARRTCQPPHGRRTGVESELFVYTDQFAQRL